MEMMILMLIMSFIGNTTDEVAESPGDFTFDGAGIEGGEPEDGWSMSTVLGALDDAVVDTWDDSSKWVPQAITSAGAVTVADDLGMLESVGGKDSSEADIFSKPYLWIGGLAAAAILLMR